MDVSDNQCGTERLHSEVRGIYQSLKGFMSGLTTDFAAGLVVGSVIQLAWTFIYDWLRKPEHVADLGLWENRHKTIAEVKAANKRTRALFKKIDVGRIIARSEAQEADLEKKRREDSGDYTSNV